MDVPPVVVIRDTEDCIRVLLYSYYTTIPGWGFYLTYRGLLSGASTWSGLGCRVKGFKVNFLICGS